MSLKQTLLDVTKIPRKYLSYLMECGLLNNMDDEKYLKLMWLIRMGRPIDLDHPRTFNEKLQWLKLHDHNPQYTIMADKYEAKKFVEERIGKEYVVPNYGVWDHFDDIDFESLPDQFVLKTTHDYAGVVVVKDRDNFDRKAAKKLLEKHLKKNHFYNTREWVYKDIKPRIIAEKLLAPKDGSELVDYKISCFNGEPKYTHIRSCDFESDILVTFNDGSAPFKANSFRLNYSLRKLLHDVEIVTFLDNDFNLIHCSNDEGPSFANPQPKPDHFDKMLDIARTLSAGIPFVRVDFYNFDGHIYVGELTFYTSAGYCDFTPQEYNDTVGDMIQLPEPNA